MWKYMWNNLELAHAQETLSRNHAAKSVRFRMASITGAEVGRRSWWRGWRRGKPAAKRYVCDARDEQRRLDRAWSHDRSAKIRQVESSGKAGEGAWMSRRVLSGLFLRRVAVLVDPCGDGPHAGAERNRKAAAGRWHPSNRNQHAEPQDRKSVR